MNLINPKYSGNKWLKLLLSGSLILCFVLVNFSRPDGIRKNIIDGDGSGIYAYLPALLIHKTVDFTPVFKFEKSRRASEYQGHYFHKVDDVLINKFSSGTALLQLPFFLLAWLASLIFGLPADGYNIFFQYAVAVAALFWAIVGLLFFVKLAKLYRVSSQVAWITGLAGFFGTNMFYYTFLAPAASHIYSFAMIAVFLYCARKIFIVYSRFSASLAAFALGLVILIRPVNILVLAILPFLAGSISNFIQTIKLKLRNKDYLFTIPLFIIAISPQLIINYLQTGSPIIDGYKNEGFYFTDPAFIPFLFSYQKGWFVYTPLMLLLIPASLYLWKRSFYEMISFVGFFILLVYVFSSWWNWIYGDSFGMRPMVDFYALFFLVIALIVAKLKRKFIKSITWIFAGLAILLNLFQTYQYSKGIIHPDSMNKAAYWHVFIKAGESNKGIVASGDEYFYGVLSEKPFFNTSINYEENVEGWNFPSKLFFVPDANHPCIKMDENSIYSSAFQYKIPKSLNNKKNIYVVFDAEYLEPQPNTATKALFVVDVSDTTGKTVFYKAFEVKRLPDDKTDEWRNGSIGFKLPQITDDMAEIKFYIWNKEKQEFYINSLALQFYTYN